MKFGVIAFVLLEPITAGLMLWDLAHGRLPLHPFRRSEAALLELRERARRYIAEHEEAEGETSRRSDGDAT